MVPPPTLLGLGVGGGGGRGTGRGYLLRRSRGAMGGIRSATVDERQGRDGEAGNDDFFS